MLAYASCYVLRINHNIIHREELLSQIGGFLTGMMYLIVIYTRFISSLPPPLHVRGLALPYDYTPLEFQYYTFPYCYLHYEWYTIDFVHCYRATCSQLNITLELEGNNSVPSTCFLTTNQRIAIYAGCSMAAVVLSFIRALLFYFICVNASRVLHNRMFASVLRAPLLFFDTNPIGM